MPQAMPPAPPAKEGRYNQNPVYEVDGFAVDTGEKRSEIDCLPVEPPSSAWSGVTGRRPVSELNAEGVISPASERSAKGMMGYLTKTKQSNLTQQSEN